MKKILFLLIIGLIFLFLAPKNVNAAGAGIGAEKNALCTPGSIEIMSIPINAVYEFDKCRGDRKAENKCCRKLSGFDACAYYLPGQSATIWDIYARLSISPSKVKSCQDLLNHASVTQKNYCPSDGTYFYIYDTTKNKCVSMENTETYTCLGGECNTAIGLIKTGNLEEFLTFVLKFAFFASGGVILLMIISTGYTIITSAGNPEKLQAAQENIVALFSGLALIAFSLVLLQAIGADILGLPGFK